MAKVPPAYWQDDEPAVAPIFRGVLGSFVEEEQLLAAHSLCDAARLPFEVFMPVTDEGLLRHLRTRTEKSGIRFWTLFGAIAGFVSAMALTVWTQRNWPLVVGGKPIVSWPPFIQPMFEWTVLFASFFCMGGFFLISGLPNLHFHPAYRPEFGVDRFGMFIPCTPAEEGMARTILTQAQAEAVLPIYDQGLGRLAEPTRTP